MVSAHWLLEELRENATNHMAVDQMPPLPGYAARCRRILGDKVLPNMVLVARL